MTFRSMAFSVPVAIVVVAVIVVGADVRVASGFALAPSRPGRAKCRREPLSPLSSRGTLSYRPTARVPTMPMPKTTTERTTATWSKTRAAPATALRASAVSSTPDDDSSSSPSSSSLSLSLSSSSVVSATSTTASATAATDDTSSSTPFPLVLWRFTRPHTLIGSALAIPSLHALAAPTFGSIATLSNMVSIVYAMIPSLLMNLYITGLNQITDVSIDRINKPNLPIASGELDMRTAVVVVLVALVSSLLMGLCHPVLGSQGLNVALWGSAILGTMYSLRPFRLKRHPLLAALCIVAVRGTIINAGFFAHAKTAAFGQVVDASLSSTVVQSTVWNCLLTDPKCALSSVFFGVFGIVIALMKDVPDVNGDEAHGIRSFSVRVGRDRVLRTMRRLLTSLFVVFGTGFIAGAVRIGMNDMGGGGTASMACRAVVGTASLAAGWSVRKEARTIDPEDEKQVYGYYMHLWKLFYLSYLFLPFAK